MTGEEAKKTLDELKAQGYSDEELLGSFYLMFVDDKISVNDMEVLSNALGYSLTDEFKNMSPEDQKTKGYELDEDSTEASKSEVEDAKEFDDEEESKESFKNRFSKDDSKDDSKDENDNKPKNENSNDKDLDEKDSDEDKKDEDEEDDETKAKRLFGFDK